MVTFVKPFVTQAFHTFIDDVVAFTGIFPMPAKHRWMTLRDDLVFFVFLYQRWLYRVDFNRADEYGYVYSDAKGGVGADGKPTKKKLIMPSAKWSSSQQKEEGKENSSATVRCFFVFLTIAKVQIANCKNGKCSNCNLRSCIGLVWSEGPNVSMCLC